LGAHGTNDPSLTAGSAVTSSISGCSQDNARLAKITCERLGNGLDNTADKSAVFLSHNLQQSSTTAQTWQFLAAAIDTYCPDQRLILTSAEQPNQ
jgi:hypothetical protein